MIATVVCPITKEAIVDYQGKEGGNSATPKSSAIDRYDGVCIMYSGGQATTLEQIFSMISANHSRCELSRFFYQYCC